MGSVSEIFEEIRSELPPDSASAKPVTYWGGGLILASFFQEGAPQLVVQISGHSLGQGVKSPSTANTKGLEVYYEDMSLGGLISTCLVLRGKPNYPKEIFFSVCDYLVDKLPKEGEHGQHIRTVERALKEWVEYWRTQYSRPTREKILGLIGELLCIRDWLDHTKVDYRSWQGPSGAIHDFRGKRIALEVKSTGKVSGPLSHEISSFEQLGLPSETRLFLLSFRLRLGSGELGSLKQLVDQVRNSEFFKSHDARDYLEFALLQAGYSDSLPIELTTFSIHSTTLYEVKGSFPRLSPELLDLDCRISSVRYVIDLSACQEFVIATAPTAFDLN